jgi:hypothetical protein
MVHRMTGQSLDPLQKGCCNKYTQKHGPLHHNDMTVWLAPCMGGNLQDGIAEDSDVDTWAFFPDQCSLHIMRQTISSDSLIQLKPSDDT